MLNYLSKVITPVYVRDNWAILLAHALNQFMKEEGTVNFQTVEPTRCHSRVINAVKITYVPLHCDRDELIRFICNRLATPTVTVKVWLGTRPITAELLDLVCYVESWEKLQLRSRFLPHWN